jgi:iron uptake system EfeUOB component EfeO/EfeM
MTDMATIVLAVIGSQIAASGLVLTVMNQRFKDFRDAIDAEFRTVNEKFKTVDARFETLGVQIHADIEALRREVRELDKPRIISGR